MKKILSIIAIALSAFSCSQAQQTEFKEEALSNTMKSVENTDITFQEILKNMCFSKEIYNELNSKISQNTTTQSEQAF